MAVWRLTKEECLTALASVPVGRVAISSAALPSIVPVNFKLIGDSVYFGAMSGSLIAAATQSAVVAFQADSYDPVLKSGWTVMGVGNAVWVIEESEFESVKDELPEPWALGHVPDEIVRIDLIRLTGHKVAV